MSAQARDAADGSAYFLYHSIGQYPGKAADLAAGMAAFAQVWGRADDSQWGVALGQRARFIDLWRAIINAPEGTLTTSENVTASVHMLIAAMPDGVLRGKRLLVAGDCFPSVHFLLTGMQERHGFTLETVPLRQGATWVEDEDMIAQWGPDVGLALITWISSTSSHRCDLNALVAHGRKMGSVVGVDITQGAGLLPFDVMAPAVDFTVSSSLKWMCGTPGGGILHVAQPLISMSKPELRGWFSQENPFSWDLDRFAYAPDIRRFDNGTPGTIACIASLPALEWHARQDHAAMVAHNRALSAQILDGLSSLGLVLASPANPDARGGSIMLRLPSKTPAPTLVNALRDAAIYTDARGQTLRLSPGFMTTNAGVERLCETIAHQLR